MNKFYLKIAIFLLFFAVSFYGQERDIRFEKYSIAQGLPDSTINVVYQDRLGYLWIGTENGLVRFDGYNYKTFKPSPEDSLSISDRKITSICEDSFGQLWVGTYEGGLNKFNRATSTFSRFKNDLSDKNSLSNNTITSLLPSSTEEGIIWIGTFNGGLNRFNVKDSLFNRILFDPSDPRSISSNRVSSLYESRMEQGVIWIGTYPGKQDGEIGGLCKYNYLTNETTRYFFVEDNPYGISDNYVTALYEDYEGYLWVGTDYGLNRLDITRNIIKRYYYDNNSSNSISHNSISSVFEDLNGLIWIGTVNGLNLYDRSTEIFKRYKTTGESSSISDDYVLSVFEDRSGILWAGTTRGLNKVNRSIRNFPHFKNNPFNKNSLSSNIVYSFLQDRKGFVWVGTRNGLNKINLKKAKYQRYHYDPMDENTISNNLIYSIYEPPSTPNIFWIGTANGLNKYDLLKDKFTRFYPIANDLNSLSYQKVVPIFEDSKKDLWIGTIGGGLNKLDRESGKFIRYTKKKDSPNSLSDNEVSYIFEDERGALWVGTMSGGLNKFNSEDETFERILLDQSDSTSYRYMVVTIYQDKFKRVWIGTRNLGLCRLNIETNEIAPFFTEKDGLPFNGISAILEDNDGNLWISTQRGLSKFNPDTKAYTNYDVEDGLQSNFFISQSAYRNKKGALFFGGDNGFNAFFPQSVTNTNSPEVQITDFKLFNQSVIPGNESQIEKHISGIEEIYLEYDENDISFDFLGFHFNRPSRNKYAFMLYPYEKSWRWVDNQRTATYTNLSPGEYVFQVKAANSDGVWSDPPKEIKISIDYPIWNRWYAYVVYFIAIGGFLFGIRQLLNERTNQKIQLRESGLRVAAAEAQARAIQAENERKSMELEEARKLQLSMLPEKVPGFDGYEIATYMQAATEVGGDYYDFLQGENGELTAAIGDATGHGLKAGTMVSVMKGLFCADGRNMDIKLFLEKASGAIKEMNLWNLYMALTLIKIDGSKVSFASAGMPPVYVVRKETGEVEEHILKGMPLGAFANFEYKQTEIYLNEGDTLIFMTDGFPELFNDKWKIYSYERVRELIESIGITSPDNYIDEFNSAIDSWRGGESIRDDITFLIIKRK